LQGGNKNDRFYEFRSALVQGSPSSLKSSVETLFNLEGSRVQVR